jgi:predicted site-specific integrase-resolvase
MDGRVVKKFEEVDLSIAQIRKELCKSSEGTDTSDLQRQIDELKAFVIDLGKVVEDLSKKMSTLKKKAAPKKKPATKKKVSSAVAGPGTVKSDD